jgi:hypothetical protein
MKNIFLLFLFLFPLSVLATDINVDALNGIKIDGLNAGNVGDVILNYPQLKDIILATVEKNITDKIANIIVPKSTKLRELENQSFEASILIDLVQKATAVGITFKSDPIPDLQSKVLPPPADESDIVADPVLINPIK